MASAIPAVASASLVSSLRTFNDLMQGVIVSLQKRQAITSGVIKRTQLLAEHALRVRALRTDFFHAMPQDRYDLPEDWDAHRSPEVIDSLHTAVTLCVDSFAAFVPAAVALLQSLETVILFPQHVKGDGEMLRLCGALALFTGSSCECLGLISPFLYSRIPAACTSLQPVLNVLVTWFLQFVRKHGPTYQGWLHIVYDCMHLCLLLISSCIIAVRIDPVTLCSIPHVLPCGFLVTLCCLACEVVPPPPASPPAPSDPRQGKSIQRYRYILMTLQETLGQCLNAHQLLNRPVPPDSDLVCPASEEVIKRGILFFHTTPGSPETHMLAAQTTLASLVATSRNTSAAPCAPPDRVPSQPGSSLSSSDYDGCRDVIGCSNSNISSCSNSNIDSCSNTNSSGNSSVLIPHNLTNDHDMVLLLLDSARKHPQAVLETSTALIGMLMSRWGTYDSTSAVVSLARILRHCSHHMRCVMQQQRKPAQQWRTQLPTYPLSPGDIFPLHPVLQLTLWKYRNTLTTAGEILTVTTELAETQQQQQQGLAGPEWVTIHGWQQQPGSSAVLEMLLRDRELPPVSEMINATIKAALVSLVAQVKENQTPSSMHGVVCLVATVHKVLQLYMYLVEIGIDQGGATEDKALYFKSVGGTLEHLQVALCGVLMSEALQKQQATGGATVIVAQDPASQSLRALLAKAQNTTRQSQNYSSSERDGVSAAALPGTARQLVAALVMIVVWMENLKVRLMQQVYGNVDCVSVEQVGEGWLAAVQIYDAELAAVVRQLLLPQLQPENWGTPAAASKQEAAAWDAYALRHFHGRLLPGCSHFGCTNTSGISEASLDTLLCSGCKRTRYCSVKCQRAAWVEGGHSGECGKGGWALSDAAA